MVVSSHPASASSRIWFWGQDEREHLIQNYRSRSVRFLGSMAPFKRVFGLFLRAIEASRQQAPQGSFIEDDPRIAMSKLGKLMGKVTLGIQHRPRNGPDVIGRFCNQLGPPLGHLSIHSIQGICNTSPYCVCVVYGYCVCVVYGNCVCVVYGFRSDPRRGNKICTNLFTCAFCHFTDDGKQRGLSGQYLRHSMDARSQSCHSRILNQILAHVGVTLGEVSQSAMLVELKDSIWILVVDARRRSTLRQIANGDTNKGHITAYPACAKNLSEAACQPRGRGVLFGILSNSWAMKKGGLCRRRRACESVNSQFSAPPSVAKTPPLGPATPTKRQMRRLGCWMHGHV